MEPDVSTNTMILSAVLTSDCEVMTLVPNVIGIDNLSGLKTIINSKYQSY